MTVEPGDEASLRSWLATWGDAVARADIDAAIPLFAPDVVGFGTRAEVAIGIDRLVADQWRHVWPAIEEFAFDVDEAGLYVSDDRLMGVVATTWTSCGPGPDGRPVPRPGRATVVLVRGSLNEAWQARHTHFSLRP